MKKQNRKLTECETIKRVLELNQNNIDLYLLYAGLLLDRGGVKTAMKVIESLFLQTKNETNLSEKENRVGQSTLVKEIGD